MKRSRGLRLSVALAAFVLAFSAAAFAQWLWELGHPVFYDLSERASLAPSTGLQWLTSLTAAVLATAAVWWVTRARTSR